MKGHYDAAVDALAINWSDVPIQESAEVEPGLILDYDKDGNVVGVELLNASKKIKHLDSQFLSRMG
ncbi:MAG: DUF2283 domain-containing protein [Chroococcidiopsidaceae cyanobacterium CP_BM_RX_35]|nr:DUF2283 domain-containing protein [Chroococcidiopsidaceae cyanobacterium CP_BM_RX_35]